MYIGPWQEYRLAKIQDDAIQRLRREWEAQLRGQLPTGEDDRIRELMQPLMAKMPSLLAPKSRTSGSSMGSRTGSSSIMSRNASRSGLSSETGSQCSSSRPPSARSTASNASVRSSSVVSRTSYIRARGSGDVSYRHTKLRDENNQDTHDGNSSRIVPKPPKPKKKGKKAALTSLEQVQKRKKMFATWIKQAGNGNNDEPEQATPEANPETKVADETTIVTKLPSINSAVPASATMLLEQDVKPKISSSLTLPPLHNLSISTEEMANTVVSHQAAVLSPRVSTISNAVDIDLDETVDEEEINKLLNWTDTLLSPHAMDALCDFDE